MKKLLIIFLMFLSLPCFAGNLLQQEDEVRFVREMTKEQQETFPNYPKQYLIKQDYEAYFNGGDSFYGEIANTIKDISKTNIPNKELNLDYLKLVRNKMQIISTMPQNSNINPVQSKIIIEDNDYKKLDKKVREIIIFANILFE